jgi:hypothetical protein
VRDLPGRGVVGDVLSRLEHTQGDRRRRPDRIASRINVGVGDRVRHRFSGALVHTGEDQEA